MKTELEQNTPAHRGKAAEVTQQACSSSTVFRKEVEADVQEYSLFLTLVTELWSIHFLNKRQ